MVEPRIPKTEEGEAEPQRDQDNALLVFRHLRDCAPWIFPRRPDREGQVLLQCSSPSEEGHSAKTTWIVERGQLASPWWQFTLSPSSRISWVSRPQQHYHTFASAVLTRFGPLRLLLPEDEAAAKVAAWTEWKRSSGNRRMFLVRFENRTSSTRSNSGNCARIDVSLHKGTILKGMLPKRKSSKYILVYGPSLGTFWFTPVCIYRPLFVSPHPSSGMHSFYRRAGSIPGHYRLDLSWTNAPGYFFLWELWFSRVNITPPTHHSQITSVNQWQYILVVNNVLAICMKTTVLHVPLQGYLNWIIKNSASCPIF